MKDLIKWTICFHKPLVALNKIIIQSKLIILIFF